MFLCANGRIVNAAITVQAGLGHLHGLRAEAVVVLHQLKDPFAAPVRPPIISGDLGDLWLLCHFHTTGLIAPNGGGFLEGGGPVR